LAIFQLFCNELQFNACKVGTGKYHYTTNQLLLV
jgi:hypothetical protein